ncbi:hypothetical protein [Salirhabdus salicampi]|uniref:hypothetical protein n=1 Tax=Salirhabdus salicampi TaxID=476102 RepID=UPI0020C4C2EF|nr:hypothetical protein [Salirhabdus salicampi]MCP8618118.1 hypothetical protein [Salirhabdus salicampi]
MEKTIFIDCEHCFYSRSFMLSLDEQNDDIQYLTQCQTCGDISDNSKGTSYVHTCRFCNGEEMDKIHEDELHMLSCPNCGEMGIAEIKEHHKQV